MRADFHDLGSTSKGLVVLAGHPALQHGPMLLLPKTTMTQPSSRADLREKNGNGDPQRTKALKLLQAHLTASRDRDPELQTILRNRTIAEITQHQAGETAH